MSVKKLVSFDFIISESLKDAKLSNPLIYNKSKYCSHGELFIVKDGVIFIIATIKENESNNEILIRVINPQYVQDIESLAASIDVHIAGHRGCEYSIVMVHE